jgi:hypothetical protein
VWGGLLDVVLQKYHWTLDYLLWGISYINVQMLLADSISTTQEEETIDADDPRNRDAIKEMLS